MRILFTSNPMHGHVETMLPLALAAHRGGHDVVFATGADLCPVVARHGLAVRNAGATHAELGGNQQASWFAYFEQAAARRLPDLVALCAAWRPVLLVHDETDLAGPIAAATVDARAVAHGLGINPPAAIADVMRAAVRRVAEQGGAPDPSEALHAQPYLHVAPPSFVAPGAGPGLWKSPRPLRHASGLAMDDEGLPDGFDRLASRPIVHLTFGTVYNDVDALARAVRALRALPVSVVVTTGPDVHEGALGAQPGHVLVARRIPHQRLLPRCALVVSHAGAGTLFGALAHGVPHLALPRGAEQAMNAAALEASGAGLALRPPEDTEAAIAQAAARLLAEPAFAEAATRLRAEIARMPSAEDVLSELVVA